MQVQLQYSLQSMPEVEGQVETYKVVEVDGQVGTYKAVLLLLQENHFLQEVLYKVLLWDVGQIPNCNVANCLSGLPHKQRVLLLNKKRS